MIRMGISTLLLIRMNPNMSVFLTLRLMRTGMNWSSVRCQSPSPIEFKNRNWGLIISTGRYFRLEDTEVSLLNQDPELPALTKMPSNERISQEGFYGGPDVLHSLHCLNAIRKHLDMDYYAESMSLPPEYRRIHIDHCVDHLRQALLCHGDLTPVTMKPVIANTSLPYPVVFYLGQTEREHTCRSADAIRSWVTARGQRTGRIEPHREHQSWSRRYFIILDFESYLDHVFSNFEKTNKESLNLMFSCFQ